MLVKKSVDDIDKITFKKAVKQLAKHYAVLFIVFVVVSKMFVFLGEQKPSEHSLFCYYSESYNDCLVKYYNTINLAHFIFIKLVFLSASLMPLYYIATYVLQQGEKEKK